MHVLVHDPFAGGHHANYVAFLAEHLRDCLDAGTVDRVTLSLSAANVEGRRLSTLEALDHPGIEVRVLADPVDASLPWRERLRLARLLHELVETLRPDAVLLTSGDSDTMVAGLVPGADLRRTAARVPVAAVLHHGGGGAALSRASRVKDALYGASASRSPWRSTFHVNPFVLEHGRRRGWGRLSLVPDPVAVDRPTDRATARRAFGLPEDARVVGHVGAVDPRKAMPELITAFAAVAGDDDRLLLAGSQPDYLRDFVRSHHPHLVEQGRLVVADRYLSEQEVETALSCLDTVATLHYPRPELSGNFLRALLLGRPVLADRTGYTGLMIERCGGVAVDVADPASVAAGVRTALTAPPEPDPGLVAGLRAFHDPVNFSRTLARAAGVDDASAEPLAASPIGAGQTRR